MNTATSSAKEERRAGEHSPEEGGVSGAVGKFHIGEPQHCAGVQEVPYTLNAVQASKRERASTSCSCVEEEREGERERGLHPGGLTRPLSLGEEESSPNERQREREREYVIQRLAAEVQLVPRRHVPMAERALLLQNA